MIYSNTTDLFLPTCCAETIRIFTAELGELSIQQIELVFALIRGETLSGYAARKKTSRQAVAQQLETILRRKPSFRFLRNL